MVIKEEVLELLQSTETYRIERTSSTGDMDKFQEAICAFQTICQIPERKVILFWVLMTMGLYLD